MSWIYGVSFRSSSMKEGGVSPLPLPGSLVVVTDHNDARGTFIYTKAASIIAKQRNSGSCGVERCIFISLMEDIEHWKAILTKNSVNCEKASGDGTLVFVDLLSSRAEEDSAILSRLFTKLEVELSKPQGTTLVILDDLAHMTWTGEDEGTLVKFLSSLRSLCRKAGAALIVGYRTLSAGSPDEAAHRYLLSTCTLHLACRPLSSGRSGSVSGELIARRGPEAWPEEVLTPLNMVLHYRCTESGAVLFERGSDKVLS